MALANLLVAALVFGATQGAVQRESSREVPLVRLKPADAELRRLIKAGFDRSTTFRSLIDAIHATNGIVTVQMGMCASGRFRSCVTDVSGNERVRTVRIKVDPRTTDNRLIATIAHELHHATEILAEDVRDANGALALYRRIGSGDCKKGLSDACETDAALAAEARVLEELYVRAHQ